MRDGGCVVVVTRPLQTRDECVVERSVQRGVRWTTDGTVGSVEDAREGRSEQRRVGPPANSHAQSARTAGCEGGVATMGWGDGAAARGVACDTATTVRRIGCRPQSQHRLWSLRQPRTWRPCRTAGIAATAHHGARPCEHTAGDGGTAPRSVHDDDDGRRAARCGGEAHSTHRTGQRGFPLERGQCEGLVVGASKA